MRVKIWEGKENSQGMMRHFPLTCTRISSKDAPAFCKYI
ncbi:hypothetical protein Gotur_015792 [Gossypium turneri]